MCCILAILLHTIKSVAKILHPPDPMPLTRIQLRNLPFHALLFGEQPNLTWLLIPTLSYARTEILSSFGRSV